MTRLQKDASFNLIMIALCPLLTALLTFYSMKRFGETLSVELVAKNFTLWAQFTLIGTAIQARRVFRIQRDSKKILFDERDQLINYRAILYAYYTICIFLIFGFMFSLGELYSDRISLTPFYILPLCLSGIVLLVVLVYSIAVLLQYRWSDKHGE